MTTLLQAMQFKSVVRATKAYQALGISVIPLRGKKASINWQIYMEKIAPTSIIHNWHNVGLLENVGIVCGGISNNLVVVDLDGLEAVADFEKMFPNYLNTLSVLTGSGKGKHYYYYAEKLSPTVRTKGYELRSDGCYVVAPPSVHPDTLQLYKTEEKDCQALVVKDMLAIEHWIRAKVMNEQTFTPKTNREGYHSANRYALSALDAECHLVETAGNGNANNTLYRSALKIAKYVAQGSISRVEVEQRLLQAARALSARDGEMASWRTIQSGMNTGLRNERG